jgi:hypothetical protein
MNRKTGNASLFGFPQTSRLEFVRLLAVFAADFEMQGRMRDSHCFTPRSFLQLFFPPLAERFDLRVRQAKRGQPDLDLDCSRRAFDGQPQKCVVQLAHGEAETALFADELKSSVDLASVIAFSVCAVFLKSSR